jgi:hypothetical protein
MTVASGFVCSSEVVAAALAFALEPVTTFDLLALAL